MTHIIEFENDKIVLSQIQQMVKVSSIKDQATLSRLLRKGLAFNPMPNYVQATDTRLLLIVGEKGKGMSSLEEKLVASIWEHKVSHGGKGEPYEFLAFSSVPEEHQNILSQCRTAGFGKPVEHDNFIYKVISSGLMRRKMK